MAIGFGAVGGAGSHRVLGLFLRTDSTIARADLGGPRGHVSLFNPTILISPTVSDDATSRADPTSHARIPRITVVATQLPQITNNMVNKVINITNNIITL